MSENNAQREILFRGRRTDNGEWVYGYFVYAHADNSAGICSEKNGCIDVDPATVGQYTGLTDKNGMKIFEGDITHVVTPTTTGNYQVKFRFAQFYIGLNMPVAYIRNFCEVIGNIHDNPELLNDKEKIEDES